MNRLNTVDNFLRYLIDKGVSTASLKYYKSDILNFLNWAGKREMNKTTVSEYLESLKLTTPKATLNRRLSTLRSYSSYIGRGFMSGISNISGFREVAKGWQHTILSRFEKKPKLKNILNKIFFVRPNWYRKYHSYPLASYIHIAILILFSSISGYAVYDQVFYSTDRLLAFPTALERPNRFLSFQGRLTDNLGNPKTVATDMVFKLYSVSSGGAALWNSGTCSITPDQDGIFSTLLGSSCGAEIASSVFSENADIWLGVTVAADAEATPRIQIATVAYALNSETLQGFPAGTGTSTIPYIDSSGVVVLANASPKIQSTSGTFAVEGVALTLTTPNTSNGIITINPDGTGTLNLTFEGAAAGASANGFVNATNANITSGALYGGTVASAATGYNFIDFQSGVSPTSKFSVQDDGDIVTTGDLNVNGDNITADGTLVVDGAGLTLQTTGAGTDITINAIDQVILTDFANCTALETSSGVLTCGSDADSGGSPVWSTLQNPAGDLTLTMAAYNTTFNWDPGDNSAETAFSLTFDGQDTAADEDQVLLALSQVANATDSTEAADALLTFANSDSNDPVENAIRFDAGAAGTDFTYGINFDAASFGTAELVLSNAETISNLVDGTLTLTSPTTALTGDLTLTDDNWLGLGSSAGLIEFDDQTTDEINFLNANVGMGTTAPGTLLHVQGSAASQEVARFAAAGASGSVQGIAYIGLDRYGGATYPGVRIGAEEIDVADSRHNLHFQTNGVNSDTEPTTKMFIQYDGNVGISDTTPDALLDLDSTATTGNIFGILSTTLTTGEIADITATYAPTDGSTNDAIDINLTHSPTTLADNFSGINLTTTDGTALGNTLYNYNSTLTLTGNAAKTGIGLLSSLSTSSTTADTLVGFDADTTVTGIITTDTRNIYGLRSQPTAGAESTGGTTNVYGGYFKPSADVGAGGTVNGYGLYVANGTFDTDGTSTNTGLYVESPTGADTNYAAIFAGGNVGIGDASPYSLLQVGNDASGNNWLTIGRVGTAQGGIQWYRNATAVDAQIYMDANEDLRISNDFGGDIVLEGGNVGIGTTGPSNLFTVNKSGVITPATASTYHFALTTAGGSPNFTMGEDASYTYIQSWGSKPLQINNQGNNVILNATAGNVGIGTTGPDAKLDSLSTTEQLRLTYTDGSVYSSFTTDSSGNLTIDNTGSKTVITDNLQVTGGSILNSVGTANIIFSATPTTTANTLSASNWLVENTANVGQAALMVNQTKSGDIFTASASGTPKFTITNAGDVGIGDTTPDALLDLDSTATTGNIFGILSTTLTTGQILDATTTFVSAAGGTHDGAIDLNLTHTPVTNTENFRGIDLDLSDGTALASTIYGYDGTLTLTGNAAKTGIGLYQTVTSSSTTADTLAALDLATTVTGIMTTGTRSIYGIRSQPTAGAESTGGTTNVYGGYFKPSADVGAGGTVNGYGLYVANGTFDTDGTSTNTGLYVESPTGADTNYAAIFAGGNVGIGNTSPNYSLEVTGTIGSRGTAPLLKLYDTDAAADAKEWSISGVDANTFRVQAINDAGSGGGNVFDLVRSGNQIEELKLGISGDVFYINTTTNNVGIGTTSPKSKIQFGNYGTLSGDAGASIHTGLGFNTYYSSGDKALVTGSRASKLELGNNGMIFYMSTGTQTADAALDSTYAERMRIDLSGNIGIGTAAAAGSRVEIENTASADDVLLLQDSSGTCEAQPTTTGLTWSCSSDQKLKTNITNASSVLDYITAIPLHDYQVIATGENVMGPIAQEMQTLYPELVRQGDDGYLSVSELTPWQIVKGIQELNKKINNLTLDDSGDVILTGDSPETYTVTTSEGVTNKIGSFAKATVAKLTAGIGSFGQIETKLISPVADSDLIIDLQPEQTAQRLVIKGQNDEEVVSIDSTGKVTAENLAINNDATVSGTLYADNIESQRLEEIEDLLKEVETNQSLLAEAGNWNISTATDSADLATYYELHTTNLYVTGQTALTSLFVSDNLTAGKIDSLDTPLQIQSLAATPLEIMAGKITIDTDGNTKFLGNVEIAGDLKINNIIVANNIDPLATESASLIEGEINSNSTAGKAVLAADSEKVRINNNKVSLNTLIYITPITSTQNKVLFVKAKDEGYFEVGFSDTLDTDVEFNWWIIDLENVQ